MYQLCTKICLLGLSVLLIYQAKSMLRRTPDLYQDHNREQQQLGLDLGPSLTQSNVIPADYKTS